MVDFILDNKFDLITVDLEFCGGNYAYVAALMQLSTIDKDFVIDSLILRDKMGPILAPVFGNKDIVKVLHGCDIDILLLISDLHIPILNIYDTARAFKELVKIGSPNKKQVNIPSFEYLANVLLDQKPDKRYQVAEWKLRPLPKVMLHYSRTDSHYLLYIYAIIEALMTPSKPIALLP